MLGAVGMDMTGSGLGGLNGFGLGGDIWSTNGFSFESPLKDLLDSQNYTVEDLLQEDELLQELRGCHEILISYLSTETAVTKLIQYIILQQPSPSLSSLSSAAARPMNGSHIPTSSKNSNNTNIDGSHDTKQKKPGKWLLRLLQDLQQSMAFMNDAQNQTQQPLDPSSSSLQLELRQIRFPYMACEIICCEIPSIINTLVDGKCIFHPSMTPTNENDISNTEKRVPSPPQDEETIVVDDDNPNEAVSDPNVVTTLPATTTAMSTITDVTQIITTDSQGDMVEVMAQTNHSTTTLEEENETAIVATAAEEEEEPPQPLSLLDLLFSLLYYTPTGAMDDYRAGYLDKILSVLFRKRPEELTAYINDGGIYGRDTLIQCMFRHLYAHSIMQITQRLLLPQRPIGQPQEQLQQEQQQAQEQSLSLKYIEDDDDDEEVANILIIPEHQIIQEEYQAQPSYDLNNNANAENGAEIMAGTDDPEAFQVRCDWGNSPEVLDMLLDKLIGPQPRSSLLSDIEDSQVLDLSLNASEVLITIIQNSMLSSTTMLTLTSNDVITRIVDAATTLPDPEYFSSHESLLTSAMNVLESLVLQLGGYGAVGTMTLLPEGDMMNPSLVQNDVGTDGNVIFEEDPAPSLTHKLTDQIQEVDSDDTLNTGQEVGLVDDNNLISDLSAMLDQLPRLLERLSFLLRHPSATLWTSPTQFSKYQPVHLLGNSRLRIVRVLESLVLLGDPDVDSILVQSNCLEICLDFFWDFQWCSMLHQSVANLLVHVFEGQNTRFEMQKYFLVKCNLLGRLMDSFTDDKCCHEIGNTINTNDQTLSAGENKNDLFETTDDKLGTQMDSDAVELPSMHGNKIVSPIDGKEVSAPGETHLSPPAQTLRCGYMGHVIIICQALVHAYTSNPHEHVMNEDADGLENDQMINMNNISYEEAEHDSSAVSSKKVRVEVEELESPLGVNSEDLEDEPFSPKDIYGDPLLLFEIVYTHQLADKWHEFVDTTLAAETEIQSTPLGGASMQIPVGDMLLSHRPGLADEGYMMGDDGEGPPVPPRGMLGGGDMIHMDENDLDIAASLMAGLSYGRPNAPDIDEDHSNNSGDSEKSYNSGETAREKVGYAFDDPLGKVGGLGIELDTLTKYSTGGAATGVPYNGDDDDGSHSSDEDDIDSKRSGSGDVPVMDLFAGNFNYEQSSIGESNVIPAEQFANFAAFDTSGTDDVGVFVTVVDEVLPVQKTANSSASAELDNLFGKGDHAELLEMDDFPTELTLSPIKPTTSFEEQNFVDVTIADNARYGDTGIANNDDMKSNLFDEQELIVEEKTMIFDVDIETAPSDELMADQIKPVSLGTMKKDIGQL